MLRKHSSLEQLLRLTKTATNTYTNASQFNIPFRGRGLFGGTMAAQATAAALLSQESPAWKPISLHCQFLKAVTQDPLTYVVEDLKSGKNYQTKQINLFQNDKLAFTAVCGIQRTKLQGSAGNLDGQLSHHRSAPCVGPLIDQNTAFETWAKKTDNSARLGELIEHYAAEPLEWKLPENMFDLEKVSSSEQSAPVSDRTLWYQVRPKVPVPDPVYQWALVAYISDYFYLSTNMRLNMRPMFTTKFSVSLDHTIYFENPITDGWTTYGVKSLVAGEGRSIMTGEMFQGPDLVATTFQQGLSVV
ncbi:hypothetical protein OGAPHI_002170 [Ogataea philodendri]|uniref:Uncharacterized protein n=1 Tax=Ogataea philodendri TaxID=1378263 RepID=A0A9P8T723_9ASCO|nr:uncharacterized protein OGAPHI_002170 [Ogataea philodendri]KAH3668416.1 hypothetical protein OGAPHI_002170 [Ogataea philodendri]